MIKNIYKVIEKSKGKFYYLLIYRIFKVYLNLFYPVYCKITKNNKQIKIAENVIVSLSSFPPRIDHVWITIETLLRQTYRPNKLILWLANSDFSSLEDLPKNLLNHQKRGLEIRFCDDLKSHKKYYYSMLNYPEHVIITVDDDTFYPENLVENLMKTHYRFPDTVCCNFGHRIVLEDNSIAPYKKWISGANDSECPSHLLVPIGCEGVLYPPGSLSNDVFDKDKIERLCPSNDDLWLKSMATINGTKAIKTQGRTFEYINLLISKTEPMHSVNVMKEMNDKQMKNLVNEYPNLLNKWRNMEE